mgnify:CR=1 FL=1
MTDEEKFQKTFDKLHASPDVLTEVLKMTAKEQVVPMTVSYTHLTLPTT